MHDALLVAATGLNAVERMLDNSAHNTVNASTPGYQRHRLVLQNFGAQLDEVEERLGLISSREVVRFAQGDLVPSPSPLAVAVEGKGFLMVEAPGVGEVLTRNGDFHMDAEGRVLTRAGYPVLAESGPLTLDPAGGEVRIDADGSVLQGGAEVAKLRVVELDDADRDRLTPVAETLYELPAGVVPTPAAATLVRHGFLEMNTNSIQGVVEMLMATKAHQTMQRAMRSLDQIMEQSIRAAE